MKPATRNAVLIFAYYAFFYGGVGCLLPYLPLYYRGIGLSGQQIGLLMGLGSIVLLVSGPLWGAVGDRFNLHRWLLPVATGGALVPMLLLPLTQELGWLIAIILLQAFFSQAIVPLIDSAALEIAETAAVPFGQLRLGGSVGFTVFATAAGWLLTTLPLVTIFYGYAFCMALAVLAALPLPARRQHWHEPMAAGLRALLGQPALVQFLISALMIGIAFSAVLFFLPLFIRDIGGDSSVLGMANAIGALAEIPILFSASRITQRLGGTWNSLAFAMACYVVRWLAMSVVTNPAHVYVLQGMHGITFGLFIVSAIAYVQAHAPPGLSATAQSMFTALVFGVGAFTGSLGGGFVYDRFGSPALFGAAAVACLLALGLLFWVRLTIRRTRPNTL